jgi:hypothetical protein
MWITHLCLTACLLPTHSLTWASQPAEAAGPLGNGRDWPRTRPASSALQQHRPSSTTRNCATEPGAQSALQRENHLGWISQRNNPCPPSLPGKPPLDHYTMTRMLRLVVQFFALHATSGAISMWACRRVPPTLPWPVVSKYICLHSCHPHLEMGRCVKGKVSEVSF